MKLIDTHDHILSAFDRQIAQYATQHFRRSGIDLVLQCRVRIYFLCLNVWLVGAPQLSATPVFRLWNLFMTRDLGGPRAISTQILDMAIPQCFACIAALRLHSGGPRRSTTLAAQKLWVLCLMAHDVFGAGQGGRARGCCRQSGRVPGR